MKTPVVAVLDVGKTNKKLALYDRQFNVVASERTVIEPGLFNGIEVEDTGALLGWFQDALKRHTGTYGVRSIAISTHGATAALLKEDGALAHPVISYTAEAGNAIQQEFYDTFGTREDLLRETCSADLGFANVGKMLYLVKTRLPEIWTQARHCLFYDSYLSYQLTGVMGTESTYLGNHTYLWDFAKSAWSAVGKALSAPSLFPMPVRRSWDELGPVKAEIAAVCGLENCRVAQGIHDSNANYLPYLAQGYAGFMLNSSGTWCVLMTPADKQELTEDEIAAKVFFNMDVLGRPVKTSVFPAGMEYDTFRGFTKTKDACTPADVQAVTAAKDLFVVPGVSPDATAFPGATARVVNGDSIAPLNVLRKESGAPYTELGQAYNAALNLALAFATRKALEQSGAKPGMTIFIEGGFANNTVYCQLLAALCPDITFCLTDVKEGTSFGAALTGWMLAEGLSLDEVGKEFTIGATPIEAADFGDLAGYEAAFKKLLSA